jgi:hypothetical protein
VTAETSIDEIIPAGQRLYRVHRASRSPAYFDTGRDGRFNPPEGLAASFGTLYLSTSPEGAFIETLGRARYLVEADIDERRLTICSFSAALRVFRVASRANRFRYHGLDLAHDAVATTSDYSKSQLLAGLVREDSNISFDGISYTARHDNSQLLTSLALFGEPGSHPAEQVFADHKTDDIPARIVDDMLRQFGFELITEVPLP